jgi:hypothetical protein
MTRNIITAVVTPTSTNRPWGARVIAVHGPTVMPGLIDLHTHITDDHGLVCRPHLDNDPSHAALRGIERLRYYGESGITSVIPTLTKPSSVSSRGCRIGACVGLVFSRPAASSPHPAATAPKVGFGAPGEPRRIPAPPRRPDPGVGPRCKVSEPRPF